MRKTKKKVEGVNLSELFEAVELLSKNTGVSIDTMCASIKRVLETSLKKQYGGKDIAVCNVNHDERKFEIFVCKNVVDEIEDPDTDILVSQALQYKSDAAAGDIVQIPVEASSLKRCTADMCKNNLRQAIRDAEQNQLKSELESRNQELISVKVVRVLPNSGDAVVSLGKVEAKLYKAEQLPNEVLKEGDIIKVYVTCVKSTDRTAKATISRTHSGLVRRLFEEEVPEIFDGSVEIKAVSREAGSRTKLAVYSKDENIDPIGACIGQSGNRVNKIVEILNGEKIDIIKYSEKPEEFIAAALAPAKVIDVTIINEEEKSCRVRVPNAQLSLAIGNKGQNARLAAKLTGWKIDIKPEEEIDEPETIDFDSVII